jgi:hypothetical protein
MVRTLGRILGGIDNIPLGGPISFVAGLGVSVAPNYRKNIDSGAPGSRILGDLLIDGVGSVVTELMSIPISLGIAGISTLIPLTAPFAPGVYIASRVSSEFYLSLVWESMVNRYEWRQLLADQLYIPPSPGISHPPSIQAPSAPNATSESKLTTPTPPNTAEMPLPTSTPPLATQVEVEIIPTQTPPPPLQD